MKFSDSPPRAATWVCWTAVVNHDVREKMSAVEMPEKNISTL